MRMNSFVGKKILSIIRDGNYAHPGEEEAIELTFKNVPKDHTRLMLDVGCGRGGTAHYLNINGWGDVTGIDIDSDSIEFANKNIIHWILLPAMWLTSQDMSIADSTCFIYLTPFMRSIINMRHWNH